MLTVDKVIRKVSPRHPPVLLLLFLIMVGGFLLRLIFFTAADPVQGFPFILDEGNYVDLAVPLSQGMGFVEKWAWLRPPGYPVYLAAMLLLGNGNLSVAALVQVLLSVANIGVIYVLAVEALARRPDISLAKRQAVGLMSAGLMAANPHVVFNSNLYMVETLYMLAFSVLLLLVLRAVRVSNVETPMPSRQVLSLMVLSGAVAAVAILMRSLLLSFMPLLLAWVWWVLPRPDGAGRHLFRPRRWAVGALASMGLLVVVMFGIIAPWTVRNYLRYDRFLLVDTVGGLNLWQYNDLIGREEVISRLAAIQNPVDRDKYAYDRAIEAILSHPGIFLRDAVDRFQASWSVEQFSELQVSIKNKYPGVDCLSMDLYAWSGTVFYAGFALLTLWGVMIAPGRALKGLFLLMLLHYLVTSIAAHVEFRYRLPLYPFTSLYAGWGMVSLIERLWRRRPRTLPAADEREESPQIHDKSRKAVVVVAGIMSLLFIVQSASIALPDFVKALRFESRYLDGKARLAKGDYAGALASFQGAEQINRGCASLYRSIGLAQGMLGQPDAERASYGTAISREEHDWRTRALLSDRLRAAGDARSFAPLRATRPEFRVVQLQWAWENLSPPARSDINLGDNDLGYISGFYSPEVEPQLDGSAIAYRWSTGKSLVRLAAPPGQGKLKLTMRWHSLSWPGKPQQTAQVRVTVGGIESGVLEARPAWEDVELALPAGLESSSPILIELQMRAEKPPGADTRSLGIAVDYLKIERSR